jgi:hypothetical protein
MAHHRGRGVATINHPIDINLGGDPAMITLVGAFARE